MEIKVGEYVRTNRGRIGQLIRIERDDIDTELKWYVFYDGKNERYINKPYITKHSKNIIDLIEEDDFVNRCKVYKNHKTYLTVYQKVKNSGVDYNFINWDEIKTILTHEQFEQNAYRLEGK